MPIPSLSKNGELPPGVHVASLAEVEQDFGSSNDRRKLLMKGLLQAVEVLKAGGVSKIFIDGSFTTEKEDPNDIDGCWSNETADPEKLDKRFWDWNTTEEFEANREELKKEFGIDFFMAEITEGASKKPFPEFFQVNRDGDPKGILLVPI
jgi:hypothetical protein